MSRELEESSRADPRPELRELERAARRCELAALVQDCHELWRSEQTPVLRRAWSLVDGAVGRGLHGRRPTRLSLRLAAVFYRRVSELHRARRAHDAVVREQRSETWNPAVRRLQLVGEAWDVLTHTWLDPALARGVWHDQTSSGLYAFLDACAEAGILEEGPGRLPGTDVVTLFPELMVHEPSVARQLVADAPHRAVATTPLWLGGSRVTAS